MNIECIRGAAHNRLGVPVIPPEGLPAESVAVIPPEGLRKTWDEVDLYEAILLNIQCDVTQDRVKWKFSIR